MAHACENCKFRAHYDAKLKSVLGRFWRWHINFCPGSRNISANDNAKPCIKAANSAYFYKVQDYMVLDLLF